MANTYQDNTSAEKMRGEYYTPPELIALMLSELGPTLHDRFVDPSCGEGRFLCGVARALAATWPARSDVYQLVDRLIGFDIDAQAVAAAREHLRQEFLALFGLDIPLEQFRIFHADALRHTSLTDLWQSLALPPLAQNERLLVIGNPPYVEAKRLGREEKQRLKELYPTALIGAADLYLYFMHVCLQWLRAQDALAFVLPNKILVNANAREVRQSLLDGAQLSGVWFATQAQLFPGTKVYPVVLFARGRGAATAIQLQHIERHGECLHIDEAQTITHDLYGHTEAKAFYPLPHQAGLRLVLERMLQRHDLAGRLDDICDIRWCVSFHRSGLREQYVTPTPPETPNARPFLGGGAFAGNGEVRRYTIDWAGWWMDYDAPRLCRQGNVVPALKLFTQEKIAICQNARTMRAAYDTRGFVLKDTFLGAIVRASAHPLSAHPRAIVGLLNSQLVHFFYAHLFYGGHVNGGYLHFLNSFLVDIPLGNWSDETARTVEGLVIRREQAADPEEQQAIETDIEGHVQQAFGVSPTEALLLQRWIAEDDNWQARERIRVMKSEE